MSDPFYNPLVETAGRIAGDYGVSIADVVALLIQANKDEAMVRQALDESLKDDPSESRIGFDRGFDLTERARAWLKDANSTRE